MILLVLFNAVIGYNYNINSKLYRHQYIASNKYFKTNLKALTSSSPSSSSINSNTNTNNSNINNSNIIVSNNVDEKDMTLPSITEDQLSVGPNALPPRTPNPLNKLILIVSLFIKVTAISIKSLGVKLVNTAVRAIIGMFHFLTSNTLRSPKLEEKKRKGSLLKDIGNFIIKYKIFIAPIALTGLLILSGFVMNFISPKSTTLEVSFASFLKLLSIAPTRIGNLRVTSNSFMYLVDGKRAITRIVHLEPNILDKLMAAGIDFAAPPSPTNYLGLIWTFAYAAFLWNMSSRMMQGPQDEGAGKRKDQGDLGKYGKLSFEDVAGQEKAKLEVKEVCDILKAPEKYTAVGARLPAGVLLVGPPGTGKTLLARVTAAEAGVPFYSCSASDFVEIFVGRGPARVRKLFTQAAKNAPCIVFIDELDSIGRSRRLGSMNSEQENTLNQLLTCMDGLDTSNNGVIVMGATNRFELLDPALLRAGRFDRIVQCPLPDKTGRLAILNVHTKKLNLSRDVDLDRVARLTPGTCGADLCAIVNEAAIRTVRRGSNLVNSDDFEDALKQFFSTRGVQLAVLAEAAGFQIPEWLKKIAGQQQSEKDGQVPVVQG